jgi:hypothetical protein
MIAQAALLPLLDFGPRDTAGVDVLQLRQAASSPRPLCIGGSPLQAVKRRRPFNLDSYLVIAISLA